MILTHTLTEIRKDHEVNLCFQVRYDEEFDTVEQVLDVWLHDSRTKLTTSILSVLNDADMIDHMIDKIDWREVWRLQRPPIHSHRWGNVNPVFHQSLMGILK